MKKKELTINHDDFLSLTTEITEKGRSFNFVAKGGSMSPFIKDGDMVLIEPCTAPPKPGDIVLIKTPQGMAILHRVIRADNEHITTRGDASHEVDGTFSMQAVVGRAKRVEGKGYNFHLKRPFNYMIARRILYTPLLSKVPVLKTLLKVVARLMG